MLASPVPRSRPSIHSPPADSEVGVLDRTARRRCRGGETDFARWPATDKFALWPSSRRSCRLPEAVVRGRVPFETTCALAKAAAVAVSSVPRMTAGLA